MSADTAPEAPSLRCAPNFRDVAATVPGLRPGLLFRSDAVIDPDEADAAQLARCGIALVLDLRGSQERAEAPNRWWSDAGVELAEFDVAGTADPRHALARLKASPDVQGAHEMMRDAYAGFVQGGLPVLRFMGERIEAGRLPMLIHCTAGKDRTGFSIALLLIALGFARDVVDLDYLASSGRPHQRAEEATRRMMDKLLGMPLGEEALARISGVHVDFLDGGLAAIELNHGSIGDYLREAGLDERRTAILRERLLFG